MNKQKTEECIDLMDEQVQLEEQEGFKEDTEEYRQSQERIYNFNEIKDVLKYLDALGNKPVVTKKWINDFIQEGMENCVQWGNPEAVERAIPELEHIGFKVIE